MSSSNPVFSVIMPCYNHERYVDYAINSVISQTLSDLELIIIDDFSTDRSKDKIRSWAKRDGRIKAIFHSKNEGIARTLNEGLKNSRGKYIALMASDDMYKENALEKALTIFELQHYSVVIVEGECIDSKNKKQGLCFSELYRKPSGHNGNFFPDLIKFNFVCTGMFKRSALGNGRISYDENLKYLNDWLFWLELAHEYKFAYIDKPLYYYRLHQTNSHKRENITGDFLKAYDFVIKKYCNSLDQQTKDYLISNREELYRQIFHPSVSDTLKKNLSSLLLQNLMFLKLYNISKKRLSPRHL
ncbi:MAG: glycosyltransferase family 2 protein [Candidatus Bathyarchaeia archaeon]